MTQFLSVSKIDAEWSWLDGVRGSGTKDSICLCLLAESPVPLVSVPYSLAPSIAFSYPSESKCVCRGVDFVPRGIWPHPETHLVITAKGKVAQGGVAAAVLWVGMWLCRVPHNAQHSPATRNSLALDVGASESDPSVTTPVPSPTPSLMADHWRPFRSCPACVFHQLHQTATQS